MKRLGIISTIWKREKLTRIFLEYYERIESPVELVKVAVISNEEDREVCEAFDSWKVIYAPNQPITDKHNAGCEYLKSQNVDAVVNMPSDNFFTSGYFDFIAGALESGADAVRLNSLFFYCLDTQRALYARGLYNAAGAMLARPVLDRVDWKPWTEGQLHATDACLYQKSERYFDQFLKIEDTLDAGFVGIDFKLKDISLNSYETLLSGLQDKCESSAEDALSHFPEIRDRILSWNKKHVKRRKRIKREPERERLPEDQLRALERLALACRGEGRFEGYWRGDRLKLRRVLTDETYTV